MKKQIENKSLILKALTDPDFRRTLKKDPTRALKSFGVKRVTDVNEKEIQKILSEVSKIEQQISVLADEILCVGYAV